MGSSETEVKALAVMPCTSSSESSVITVMPVAKDPNALRNSACVTLIEKLKDKRRSALRPYEASDTLSRSRIALGGVGWGHHPDSQGRRSHASCMISILGPLGTLKGPQRTTVNRGADSMSPVSLASELSDLQIGAPLSRKSACR